MTEKNRIKINKQQQEFYDHKSKNLPTRIWSNFRNGSLNRIKKAVGVERDIHELHKSWLGDLSGKKVLDLGCFEGNSLSVYMAQESQEYLGIDLSPKGIETLRWRLGDLPGARAEVMDFLSADFKEQDFDIIYAYGVLHHFKDVPELIARLKEKLKENGLVISHDPLQTSWPIRFLRGVYRPFQSDKAWEWPFSKKTYYQFQDAFELRERRAVLGRTKWAAFLGLLPLSIGKKEALVRKWHQKDWETSAVSEKDMFRGMHLSMLLQKK